MSLAKPRPRDRVIARDARALKESAASFQRPPHRYNIYASYIRTRAMNFNVYLDDPTVDRLNALARKRGTTRNALIREAISHLLARKEDSGWPEAVVAFEGDPEAPRFEEARSALKPPRKDPLA